MKSMIQKKVIERLQKKWEEETTGRWYYTIQRKVGAGRTKARSQREETLSSSLRFGHTRPPIWNNPAEDENAKIFNVLLSTDPLRKSERLGTYQSPPL